MHSIPNTLAVLGTCHPHEVAGLLSIPRLTCFLPMACAFKRHRDPSSFTPSPNVGGDYLFLGADEEKNRDSIATFSEKDVSAGAGVADVVRRIVLFN